MSQSIFTPEKLKNMPDKMVVEPMTSGMVARCSEMINITPRHSNNKDNIQDYVGIKKLDSVSKYHILEPT